MKRTLVWGLLFFLMTPFLVYSVPPESPVVEKPIMDKPVADKSVEEHYQDAEKYLNEENYDKAIEELLQILSKDPNLAAVYNLLGIAYLKQNKSIQSAIGSFQQAIRVDPSFTDAYFNLGITYAGAGNEPLEAVKYFEKAIEINPKFAKAYMGLGWVTLFEKKDPEQAEVLFQKAIDVSENKLDEAYFGLGMAYVTMGKKERALGPVSVLRSINRFDLAATLESLINEESKKNEVSEDGDQPAIQPAAAETPAPVLP